MTGFHINIPKDDIHMNDESPITPQDGVYGSIRRALTTMGTVAALSLTVALAPAFAIDAVLSRTVDDAGRTYADLVRKGCPGLAPMIDHLDRDARLPAADMESIARRVDADRATPAGRMACRV